MVAESGQRDRLLMRGKGNEIGKGKGKGKEGKEQKRNEKMERRGKER